MGPLELRIVSPEGVLAETTAQYVRLQATDGSLGILPGHAPMIAAIAEGNVFYRGSDGAEGEVYVDRGVAEICDNKIVIIAG